ncbi:coiled-coil and C2 domain-containing protein 2A-like isoform X2 [Palaemon carinicauda]|uniref:coiled-coil and C2 domain-containing protein 2A-like isoform X2 n=1 Tax=Palaemon carinicauda TaxID=392227 RepID=UPI0035B6960B
MMKMASEHRDVERQDLGEPSRFVPGVSGVQIITKEVADSRAEETSHADRKRPGRLRKKFSTRPTTRFDEAKASSKIESQEFFTQIWPKDQPRTSPVRESKKKTPKSPSTGEETDKLSLVAPSSYLTSQVVPATYVQGYEDLVMENLFIPSVLPSDSQSKVNADELRDLEDEGLFVGEKPYVSLTNLHIIENRLLQQKNKRWFLETGLLDRMDNPINDKIFHHLPADRDVDLEPLTAFIEPKFGEELQLINQEDGGMLDLEIHQLTFAHHPLFSSEHFLGAQLKDYYKTYSRRALLNVTKLLKEKLTVVREAFAKIENSEVRRSQQSRSVRDEMDIAQRRNIYQKEIRECREEYNSEAEKDRVLLMDILKVWKNIKDLRKRNKYHTTPLKLIIKKEEVNKEEEEEQRKEELRQDMAEVLREHEIAFEKDMQKYKQVLTEWKAAYKKKREAKKRQQRRKQMAIEEELEDSALHAAQDEVLLATPDEEKPVPPATIDKRKIELEVLDTFSRTRKPPGEPNILLELSESSPVTKDSNCPDGEKRRRQIVSKSRVSVKVLINRKLVTQTPLIALGNDFTLHINQSYRMGLSSFPHSLSLEIVEGSGLREAQVAVVSLPIPSKSILCNDQFSLIDFLGTQQVSCSHTGIGCGQPNSDYGSSFTRGTIWYHLSRNSEDEAETAHPAVPSSQPVELTSVTDIEKTHSKDEDYSHIDPNDPGNCELLAHLQKSSGGTVKSGNYFELESCEGDFYSDLELDTNVRFRVLQLRDKEEPAFKNLRLIPPHESQILRKSLEAYEEQSMVGSGPVESAVPDSHLWGIDRRWENVEKLLASLRRHMQQRYMQANLAFKLEDLVQEERIPDIGTIGTSLLSIFKARRPLRPERKKRDQVRGTALGDQNVRLIVHVAQAFHVPIRHESAVASGSSSEVVQGSSTVRPFIEATFQRTILRTSIAEGPNPTWNQQLSFPFKAPNDNFSPSSLQTVTDNIYFHLYDEVIHDMLEDDRLRESTVHHRIERRWLGSLKIPFSTIYTNSKIEGTFSLEEPVVLLGYIRDSVSTVSPSRFIHNGEPNKSGTHLTIYLTLEPTLPPPEPFKAQFDSSEPEDIIIASKEWEASLSSKFSQRLFRTHVLDLSGKLVSMNRFIRPLKPPVELISENASETLQKVAWYVSLIPSLADMTLFPGACDIWANSEQFLTMLTGDEEEHAVLLTNFFLYLGKTAFLLVGSGIPEGQTCYVVTLEDNGSWTLWNPSTAKSFSAQESFSPLKAVYLLINEENIWANVQKYDDPPRVNFDVKGSGWRSFFSRSVPDPGLPSVQPARINFQSVDSSQIEQLKDHLEVVLRDAIMKWRSVQRTSWNRHAIKVLRKLISGLDDARAAGKSATPDISQLASVMASHKVCGVCIHQGYSNLANVVEAVHSTGVHLTQAPNVEFALAVYVKSYPAYVISVWVYVASLVKRQ